MPDSRNIFPKPLHRTEFKLIVTAHHDGTFATRQAAVTVWTTGVDSLNGLIEDADGIVTHWLKLTHGAKHQSDAVVVSFWENGWMKHPQDERHGKNLLQKIFSGDAVVHAQWLPACPNSHSSTLGSVSRQSL